MRSRDEMVKRPEESDGTCFAVIAGNVCGLLKQANEGCGTYACEFYKPCDCKDWIRVIDKDEILFITPEEYRRLWP